MRQLTDNRDYVAALVHGRRSRMAEGPRLEALCQVRTVEEFAIQTLGDPAARSAPEVQRRLLQAIATETAELARHLNREAAALAVWLVARYHVEDLKVLLRRLITGAPEEAVLQHILSLPADLGLNIEALARAESLDAFVSAMPSGILRRGLGDAVDFYREQPRAFYFEAALDRAYFAELLVRADAFPRREGELTRPLMKQETDIFHLMLVTRGKLIYGLEPAALAPLHVSGTRISRDLFENMLAETDLSAVVSHAIGRVIDRSEHLLGGETEFSEKLDPARLERLAWSRFWRLASRAFRQSHMGLATVIAYVEIRRVEVANLITICEGIRAGVPPDKLLARLIPLANAEAIHV